MKLNVLLLGILVTTVLAFPVTLNSRHDGFSLGELYISTLEPYKFKISLLVTDSAIAKRDSERLVERPEYTGGKVKPRAEEVVHPVKRPNYVGGKVKARAEAVAHTDILHPVERPDYYGGKVKARAEEVAHTDVEYPVERPAYNGGRIKV